jgi:LCP family protein required for cell wall assembly
MVRLMVAIPLVLAILTVAFVAHEFGKIPRVPVGDVLSSNRGLGVNWLIVGTDSREGVVEGDPGAAELLGPGVPTGSRTDTIMVLRTGGGGDALLSIPRDLWVKDPRTGKDGRINATYGAGPANLLGAVQAVGIPVHHYAEINFVSFGRVVDAVGGIDVNFEFPARDTHSGLVVDQAGPVHLGGSQALAYVRSRYYEELRNGKWQQQPLSDLARVQRQRIFLTTLLHEVSTTRNPLALRNITDSLTSGLRIDDAVGLLDALRLAWGLRSFHPESLTLATTPARRGGADVLDLNKAEAAPVIQAFGG